MASNFVGPAKNMTVMQFYNMCALLSGKLLHPALTAVTQH